MPRAIPRCTALLLASMAFSHLTAEPVRGQTLAVGDPDEAYLRVLQLLGRAPTKSSMMIRPLSMRAGLGAGADTVPHPWAGRWGSSFRDQEDGVVHLHDPQARSFFFSQYPERLNEGALTLGRHFTGALDVGVTARKGPLSVSVRPTMAWVQNSGFALAEVEVSGQPEFAYAWQRIDAPQRFGPEPYWLFDLGQSEIRLDYGGVSASFGTTNLWWGPGRRNAILMSNSAGGFPHASLETGGPVDIGIGTFEAQWIFGRLHESDWFDDSIEDVGRYLTGAAVTFSPDFWGLDGLSVGAARAFLALVPPDGIPLGEYFLVFQTPIKASLVTPERPGGNDDRDQLFSAFARWVLPASGFEVYAEWARNDHSTTLEDYFLVLGNTQAYTLGFQKVSELSSGSLLVFNGELTQMENPNDVDVYRSVGSYYAHGLIPRGYTHKGQLLGAAIGGGSNVQFLGADFYGAWGGWSAFVQRLLYDKNAFSDIRRSGRGMSVDAEASGGGSVTLFRGGWDVEGGIVYARRFHWYFSSQTKSNLRLTVNARWRLGLR